MEELMLEHPLKKPNDIWNILNEGRGSQTFGRINYSKGQILYHENNPASELYFLLSGKVKIYKTDKNKKKQLVHLVLPGEFFAYSDVLTSSNYSASAVFIEEGEVKVIPRLTVLALLSTPDFLQSFLQSLCRNTDNAYTKFAEMASKPVRGRLAKALLTLNQLNSNDVTPVINLSREDLAGFVGSVPETVCRFLTEFRLEKIISIENKKIKVLNAKRLEEISNL